MAAKKRPMGARHIEQLLTGDMPTLFFVATLQLSMRVVALTGHGGHWSSTKEEKQIILETSVAMMALEFVLVVGCVFVFYFGICFGIMSLYVFGGKSQQRSSGASREGAVCQESSPTLRKVGMAW